MKTFGTNSAPGNRNAALSSPSSYLRLVFLLPPIFPCYFLYLDGDIFLLEKLLIPVNITSTHYFIICVYMKHKIIQAFDSLPDRATGRLPYLEKVFFYLQAEHKYKNKDSPSPDRSFWKLNPSSPLDGVPRQSSTSNDCGIYTCLFMDFLLLDLPVDSLLQNRIAKYGRQWLCKCVLSKSIVF